MASEYREEFNYAPIDHDKIKDIMLKGDKRCLLQIGTRVIKYVMEDQDRTPVGTKGTVWGNLYVDNDDLLKHFSNREDYRNAYLVEFDTDPPGALTFIVGNKIREIEKLGHYLSAEYRDKLADLNIGDKVTRVLGEKIRMSMVVTKRTAELITCTVDVNSADLKKAIEGGVDIAKRFFDNPELTEINVNKMIKDNPPSWTFSGRTGAEVDEHLGWDGINTTGSYLQF